MWVIELVDRLPERFTKVVATLTVALLLLLAPIAYSLESGWRNSRVAADVELSKQLQATTILVSSLAASVSDLTQTIYSNRSEIAEYREEVRQLRKEQAEASRHIQRALDLMERRKEK